MTTPTEQHPMMAQARILKQMIGALSDADSESMGLETFSYAYWEHMALAALTTTQAAEDAAYQRGLEDAANVASNHVYLSRPDIIAAILALGAGGEEA